MKSDKCRGFFVLLCCVVAFGLGILSLMPTTEWYHYELGVTTANASSMYETLYNSTKTDMDQLYKISYYCELAGSFTQFLLFNILVLYCLFKSESVVKNFRWLSLFFIFVGLSIFTSLSVYFAIQHPVIVEQNNMCPLLDSQQTCSNQFFGSTTVNGIKITWGPGLGWYATCGSAVSLIVAFFIHLTSFCKRKDEYVRI